MEEYSELYPGDKVYYINREKNIYIAVIGEENLEGGINIVGAHIDSPRLDLKPNPLYEDGELAYFNTHYYGGIKEIPMDSNSTCNSWSYSKRKWRESIYFTR